MKISKEPETKKNSPALTGKSGTINKIFTNQAAATVFLLIPKTQPTTEPMIAVITAATAASAATPFNSIPFPSPYITRLKLKLINNPTTKPVPAPPLAVDTFPLLRI